MPTVFVYGSLMQGFHNHHRLDGSEFLGRARTVTGGFRMLSLGSFPGLICYEGGGHVMGEVYEVTAEVLKDLDRLEGYPRFYTRQQVAVRRTDGDPQAAEVTKAWVYTLADPKSYDDQFMVPDNDWRAFSKSTAPAPVENPYDVEDECDLCGNPDANLIDGICDGCRDDQ